MTGFGRSQSQTGGAMPPERNPRVPYPPHANPSPPAHASHASMAILQQLVRHLPLAYRQRHVPAIHPLPASGNDHGLLQALTHSLDLAGRGYCCLANPLEETAAREGTAVEAATRNEAHMDQARADSLRNPKQDAGGNQR